MTSKSGKESSKSQRAERDVITSQFKELRKDQAQQLLELRKDVGRYLQFTRGCPAHDSPARTQGRDLSRSLKLER